MHRSRRPSLRLLRLAVLFAPAGLAFYGLACGDASDTSAQDYNPDLPPTLVTTGDASVSGNPSAMGLSDGGGGTGTGIVDVYIPTPMFDTGVHDGTLALTSTNCASGASTDLFSSGSIPLTVTPGAGFSGPVAFTVLGLPNNFTFGLSPDSFSVSGTASTATLTINSGNGASVGTVKFSVIATGGSNAIDAGAPVLECALTVNPKLTITIPGVFETNPSYRFPTYYIGGGSSLATNPIRVIFQNDDQTNWFEVGANAPQVGFADGQQAIAPNTTGTDPTEPDFSPGTTDAGTARVIDQKGQFNFWSKGFGTSKAIAESGGGTDGGNAMPYPGQINVQ